MQDYYDIIERILESGTVKEGRNGTTLSIFAPQFRHDMADGFPLDTSRFISFKIVKHELLWFLSGQCKSITWLNHHGIHIWDQWAKPSGLLGPIYGVQWREWMPGMHDQIHDAIQRLRENPYDRRAVVSAWNVGELDQMQLPPCHVMFQLVYDGRLNLHMYQRSADWMIGVPYNIASYGLLLFILSQVLDMEPGILAISYGDAHIYEEHVGDAYLQLDRERFSLPTLLLNKQLVTVDGFSPDDITIANYNCHDRINYEVKQ